MIKIRYKRVIDIYRSFIKEINSSTIKKLYLLYGCESYLLDKGLEEVKARVVTGFEEINYSVFEGKDIDISQLQNACETLPFGSNKKLVVVKDYLGLKSKSKKSQSEKDESISEHDRLNNMSFINNLTDDVCLLFISYGEIDKRKKLYKDLNKFGSVFEFKKIDKGDLKQWISKFFTKEGKKIGYEEIEYFIRNTGYMDKNSEVNMYYVQNEMEKVLSYTGEEKIISIDSIKALIHEPLENNIFKLIDACLEGDTSGSLKIYLDLLLEGESSYSIIALISWGIKNIIKIKELKEEGLDAKNISSKLKMKEFIVRKNINHCNKIDFIKLEKALERCIQCEIDIKTGKLAEKIAVEMLLTSLF